MLLQAGHELGQVAGTEADIELEAQDLLPAVAAGAGRAGQREEIGAAGDTARGPALHGGGADLLEAEPPKELAEAVYLLLEQGLEGLGGDVSAGDAGTAGGDHHLDPGIGDPAPELLGDGRALVLDDGTVDQHMAVAGDEFGQSPARGVVGLAAGIGYRQDRDMDRLKAPAFVNSTRHRASRC